MDQYYTPYPQNLTDFGPDPFVVDIECASTSNHNYRVALWTGNFLQLTLMSIPAGGEIGLEVHPDTDQFIRVEKGVGLVVMGYEKDQLVYHQPVTSGYGIFVPAGTWHNVINTGSIPMSLYTIYAPPHHPHGTVHVTKAQADAQGD